jgi:NAD(P)-dependent dehydrogenase (short-subunit alcohol dehydrogenase family)
MAKPKTLSDSLSGRVAFITGAGSPTGIGMGCAHALAAKGARLAIAATTRARAETQAAALRAEGHDAIAVCGDVSDEAQVTAMVGQIAAHFERIDILINNAASSGSLAKDGSVAEIELAAWEETFSVNTRGVMLCIKHVAPHMLRQESGSIINITSQAARSGSHHAAYGASKAAVENLSQHAAFVLGKQGVRVNCIAPGLIQSQLFDLPDAFTSLWSQQTLTRRLGIPADIGAMAAFLASDAAGYITGQIIEVDGGVMAHATWTGIPKW